MQQIGQHHSKNKDYKETFGSLFFRLLEKKMNKKAFTLIELIMVIVILGVISFVVVGKYINFRTESGEVTTQTTHSLLVTTSNSAYTAFHVSQKDEHNIDTPQKLINLIHNSENLTAGVDYIDYDLLGTTYRMAFTPASISSPAKLDEPVKQ